MGGESPLPSESDRTGDAVAESEKGPGSITNGSSNGFAHGGPRPAAHGTRRGIKSRQAQMLAIGGTIGA